MNRESRKATIIESTGNSGMRANRLAFGLAIVMLVVGRFAYESGAEWLGRQGPSVRIPGGTLSRLSLQIGTWSGQDEPLEPDVVRATGTDDHINRTYRDHANRAQVSLFIGFGISLRDLAPHRPEVCYPGAGWTLERSEELRLTLGDGESLPCRLHLFDRGGLDAERIMVLNYYIVDGAYCPDVSLLRSRQWRRSKSDPSYAVQVQVSSSGEVSGDTASTAVREFATASGPAIRALLEELVEESLLRPAS